MFISTLSIKLGLVFKLNTLHNLLHSGRGGWFKPVWDQKAKADRRELQLRLCGLDLIKFLVRQIGRMFLIKSLVVLSVF